MRGTAKVTRLDNAQSIVARMGSRSCCWSAGAASADPLNTACTRFLPFSIFGRISRTLLMSSSGVRSKASQTGAKTIQGHGSLIGSRPSKNGGSRAAVWLFANCYLLIALLRSFAPARQIFFLLRREFVDLYAHGFEFQPRYFFIQLFRHGIDLLLQRF